MSFDDATLNGMPVESEFLDNIFGHMGPFCQSQAAPTVTIKHLNDKLLLGRRVHVQMSTDSIPNAYYATTMGLRVHLQDIGGRDGLVRLNCLPDDRVGGQYIFEAQFETWEQARVAYNTTNGLTAWWTIHKLLVAHLADQYPYHIIVSLWQYHTQ
ncbi:hypothetical protein FISHEDRAFT_59892 [Fistulina hepatica ATCC 64428]|uniref:Uncharacterized protein n=1 Tax=Fistulina hepatica ATCC 64428 TaxID=1128425 RepID=A0A0D7A7V7_9AGAR|nr:hypothetical protein FISHEDRAFT_59892 [Fistulina hepatica ATCC 64428]